MKPRTWVLIGVSVLWAGLVVLWPVSTNLAPAPDAAARAQGEGLYKTSLTQANFGLMGVRFFQSNGGKPRWHIKSEFAELHRRDNYAFMKTVVAEFTADRTRNVVTTNSRFGRSHLDKKDVELEGDVQVRSRTGYLFEMERLHYDGATHEFRSNDTVNMRGPDVSRPRMTLRGTGLVASIDDEHFILKKNVLAQRRLGKPNEWMRISSRSGEFFTEEQRSIFTTRVRAVLPSMGIDSDRLELNLVNDRESLSAKGNVILRSRDRTGYADSAFIELGNNRIVLEGKARVDARNNEIRGRRILLYTDDDRIEVEEAEGKAKG